MAGIRLYRRTGPNSGFSVGLGSLVLGLFLIPCLAVYAGKWILMDPVRIVMAVVFIGIFAAVARPPRPRSADEFSTRQPPWDRD
jgi:hypothetical protein